MRKYLIISTVTIVTLITDLGKDTYVVAKAKAKLLAAVPSVSIIDISHTVTPFLIDEAVFFAKSCINDFPEGTIHLIAVDADIKKYKKLLACKFKGQIFITVDNGFISILTGNQTCEVFSLPYEGLPYNTLSPLKTLLCPIAIRVINEGLENIGRREENFLEKTVEQPIVFENGLRGKVLYINNYNNVITNISRALFDNERVGRRFNIVLNRFDNISNLSESYNDVGIGDNLCFFNADGLLEIAINRGSASKLLGLEKDKRITIEFFADRAVSETREQGLL